MRKGLDRLLDWLHGWLPVTRRHLEERESQLEAHFLTSLLLRASTTTTDDLSRRVTDLSAALQLATGQLTEKAGSAEILSLRDEHLRLREYAHAFGLRVAKLEDALGLKFVQDRHMPVDELIGLVSKKPPRKPGWARKLRAPRRRARK